MWGVFDKAVDFVRSRSTEEKKKLVYRDELSKAPLIQREERNGDKGIRVKILMTKEEAERLLSKCKDRGSLEFKDVVHELMNIPADRVTVVHDAVLNSIPEEC